MKQKLTSAMRALPAEPVKDYTLTHAPSGSPVGLAELFGDSRELILIHNMGKRCPYCTLWAVGFASIYEHAANRCAFVLTTPDEPAVTGAFGSARGWKFPILLHAETTFAADMGYHGEESTFGPYEPGISTFEKRDSGQVVRVTTRSFGPGDH